MSERAPSSTKRAAQSFIVFMGVVALFGDMTYEGARGLVGHYLALHGASATALGFAAGLGEFLGYGNSLVTGWDGEALALAFGFAALIAVSFLAAASFALRTRLVRG